MGNNDHSVDTFCLIMSYHRCIENTGGWKCEECLPRHWGNAALRDCKPCNCYPEGSESLECNPITGQCQCKPNFTGLRCDRCAPGYGNLEQNCVACQCDLIGSTSPNCDEATGQCPCRPGVFGLHCSQCLDGHFGFSEKGCQPCKCDPNGSEGPECNPLTGQCKCKPFVIGRDCSHCEPGYWNLASGNGCEPCNCNFTGSVSQVCDEIYGQCDCKPGVGGKHCDRCLPGYYGFSAFGCNQCDPCTAPGHICDSKTGRCVCPPNTAGPTCQDCAPGTWGFDVLTGCSPCDCNLQGSVNNECDHKTGIKTINQRQVSITFLLLVSKAIVSVWRVSKAVTATNANSDITGFPTVDVVTVMNLAPNPTSAARMADVSAMRRVSARVRPTSRAGGVISAKKGHSPYQPTTPWVALNVSALERHPNVNSLRWCGTNSFCLSEKWPLRSEIQISRLCTLSS